jgi:hypothetical protein
MAATDASSAVMAGLVPAIHVEPLRDGCWLTRSRPTPLIRRFPDVDGRHKAGHDAWGMAKNV